MDPNLPVTWLETSGFQNLSTIESPVCGHEHIAAKIRYEGLPSYLLIITLGVCSCTQTPVYLEYQNHQPDRKKLQKPTLDFTIALDQ